MLYKDEEMAKSVADEYTRNPPVYKDHFALDVKLYHEPKGIPKGRSSAFLPCNGKTWIQWYTHAMSFNSPV